MRDVMRYLHYSIHTERAYGDWIARFVRFHQMDSRDALFVDAEKIKTRGQSHLWHHSLLSLDFFGRPLLACPTLHFSFASIFSRK